MVDDVGPMGDGMILGLLTVKIWWIVYAFIVAYGLFEIDKISNEKYHIRWYIIFGWAFVGMIRFW